MARKKQKQNNNSNSNNNQNEIEKLNNLTKDIDELKERESITQDEIDGQEVEINSANLQVKNIEKNFKDAVTIKSILEKRQITLDDKIKKVEDEEKEYKKKSEELDQSIKKYDEELEDINKLRVGNFSNIIDKSIIDKYAKSLDEQKDLLIQEIEKLKKEQVNYIELISGKEQAISSTKMELNLKKEKLEQEYHEKVEEKEEELDRKLRDIRKQEKQLNYDIEDFDDDKEFLYNQAKKEVAEELEQLKSKYNITLEKIQVLQNTHEKREDELKYLGGRDPKLLIDDLTQKENKIWELEQKLSANTDLVNLDRLKQLTLEKIDYEANIRELEAKANEYKTQYEKQKIEVNEIETLQFQKEELETRLQLQQSALSELKNEVNELVEISKEKHTFISCMDMDLKFNVDVENDVKNYGFSDKWLDGLQQIIAQVTKETLYYDANTIRSYIAGLSMSRLSILQGISGTGKTSLPKAFAQAIGGHFEIVEVQSGWKDRQDLIGYYNTFEKKYYESSFLKALYKANTPAYRNKPFFIILDEMNLSHPEHYFADLLSIMETDIDYQYIKICDSVANNPKFMEEVESELILKIPSNVWFIGTANHDETTVQFAPKTYDRANIMEMPKNHMIFDILPAEGDQLKLMTQDNQKFNSELDKDNYNSNMIIEYLNDSNFKIICNDLGIGWGNRLEKQIKRFIPTFISLGGSEADAIDQLISSKILRTLKGRYDLQLAVLEDLKDELETSFLEKFDGIPEKCLEIVNEEIKNKEE